MIKSKLQIVTLAAMVALVLCAGSAHAEDNGFVSFFKKVFNYPVKTTENAAHATGNVVSNTGGVAASAVDNTGATLSGKIDRAPHIIADPVAKAVNMTGQAASEVAGAPVKAAEDVQKIQ